jgi:hypothetical protein
LYCRTTSRKGHNSDTPHRLRPAHCRQTSEKSEKEDRCQGIWWGAGGATGKAMDITHCDSNDHLRSGMECSGDALGGGSPLNIVLLQPQKGGGGVCKRRSDLDTCVRRRVDTCVR